MKTQIVEGQLWKEKSLKFKVSLNLQISWFVDILLKGGQKWPFCVNTCLIIPFISAKKKR